MNIATNLRDCSYSSNEVESLAPVSMFNLTRTLDFSPTVKSAIDEAVRIGIADRWQKLQGTDGATVRFHVKEIVRSLDEDVGRLADSRDVMRDQIADVASRLCQIEELRRKPVRRARKKSSK